MANSLVGQHGILTEEVVWGPRFGRYVKVHQVVYPDGETQKDYYTFGASDWGMTVAVTADEKIVMIRQFVPGHGYLWLLPVGSVKEGADPLVLAQKELLEESGFRSKQWQSLSECFMHGNSPETWGHYFLATACQRVSDQKLERGEKIKVHLKTIAEIIVMLKSFEITDHGTNVALWRALQILGYIKFNLGGE